LAHVANRAGNSILLEVQMKLFSALTGLVIIVSSFNLMATEFCGKIESIKSHGFDPHPHFRYPTSYGFIASIVNKDGVKKDQPVQGSPFSDLLMTAYSSNTTICIDPSGFSVRILRTP
jgi:hypothetical protein